MSSVSPDSPSAASPPLLDPTSSNTPTDLSLSSSPILQPANANASNNNNNANNANNTNDNDLGVNPQLQQQPHQQQFMGPMGHMNNNMLMGPGSQPYGSPEFEDLDQANLLAAALASNQILMPRGPQSDESMQGPMGPLGMGAMGPLGGMGGMGVGMGVGPSPLGMNGPMGVGMGVGPGVPGGGVEICRAFLAGRCGRGAACRFMHVDNQTQHQQQNGPHVRHVRNKQQTNNQ